jgi:hypothetical protein
MANNSYFVTDKEIDDIAKKVVSELYNNIDIVNLKNNGRPLTGNLAALIERQITGIYSNIQGKRSLQSLLINAIRYSVLIEKNTTLDAEFKKLREACERRKNTLSVMERKLLTDKDNQQLILEIDKAKLEISLLEEKINEIAEKNSEPPTIKKNILELAKKTYKLLLRSDKTSEKLYTAICEKLNIKIDNDHFGYYQYNNKSNYQQYQQYQQYQPEKKDVYIPPDLKYFSKRRY